jgi:hypothetical protein
MSGGARLIVSVPWGPHAGLKVGVAPGSSVRVGRNERADLAVADDALAAVHFELSWDGARGRVRELGSAAGMRVGGAPAREGEIEDGAWIRAGSTDFILRVEGAATVGPPPPDAERRARVAAALGEIAQTGQLYGVLDAARDDRILELCATAIDEARSLYEGARGDGMALFAPHLVRFSPGSPLLERLVLLGWGARWGIFLVSDQPFKAVRRHLRRLLVVEDETGEELYFRFYDPEILRTFLPSCLPAQAAELGEDVEAFLFEGEGGALVRRDRDEARRAAEALAS